MKTVARRNHAVVAPSTTGERESWIEKAPGVCGGDARVRKTRVTVWGLVQRRDAGLSDAEILDALPDLTPADLAEAWRYYEQRHNEIRKAIEDNGEA